MKHPQTNQKRSRKRRVGLLLIGLLLMLCVGGTAVSAITNRRLPTDEIDNAQLTALDKTRLAEMTQLRQTVGAAVWPGWESASIPLIVYNDAYAFLVGVDAPPSHGWIKLPQETQRGNSWEVTPNDTFMGQPYYRTPLSADGPTPQAFTVRVGEQWAASLPTRAAMRVTMAREFRGLLPGGVRELLPYALATNLFLRNSDSYIAAMLHESFHAFQGMQAPQRLAAAEWAVIHQEDAYPHTADAFVDDWQTELDLLQTAVRATDPAETADLVRQFLAQRAARRDAANLTLAQIEYERQREWLEGSAMYVELAVLRQAAADAYHPTPQLVDDPEFDQYDTFDARWRQEVDQIARMAGNDGDGRFYYSGMAQATLLDRLLPDWKTRYFDNAVTLEALLATAVSE